MGNFLSNILHSGKREEEILNVEYNPGRPRVSSGLRLEEIQAQIVLEKDPEHKAELVKAYNGVMAEYNKSGGGEKRK